jgi:predicted dehydrogenase
VTATTATRPRLGFIGVGWIGRNRLDALVRSGAAEVAAVADPAVREVDGLRCLESADELLARDLDGVVIASPSALHAPQAIAALDRGLPVFCQKPLGLNAREARQVVAAARRADRLLGLDLSYRHLEAVRKLRTVVENGGIGRIFAADLVFHNAYGPDRDWFYDPKLSGGGCVIDLGIHLVDLALWLLGFPQVAAVESRLFHGGHELAPNEAAAEDYAVARLDLEHGAVLRAACSWRLHAGRDCAIEVSFYGTDGGISVRNVDGSYYDFVAELYRGTATEVLSAPPDDWGGRAATKWARRLATDRSFDPAAERFVDVADVIDRIYECRG